MLTFLCFAFAFSSAQNTSLHQQFRTAVTAGEAKASTLLDQILSTDSLYAWEVADAAEQLFLGPEGNVEPTPESLDRLYQIYGTGIRHDRAAPEAWQARRAFLAIRFTEHAGKRKHRYLQAAIEADPQNCPLLFYQAWLEEGLSRYKANRYPLNRLAEDWAKATRFLHTREVAAGSDAEATNRTFRKLALRMRDGIPDCALLYAQFRDGIDGEVLEAAGCATYMILGALHTCDHPALWLKARDKVLQDAPTAWAYRLAAAEALDRGAHTESRDYWQAAFRMESSAELKASDKLHEGHVLGLMGDFRAARMTIREAMRLHPTWGEPYMQLADLYLAGSSKSDCEYFTAFDRKAVYWLLIDLVQKARNVDARYEQEAIRRQYEYGRKAPTPEEATFKGLRSGDTWPLKCWMSTVTTVKMD
ncbi:MAG: hypothetical protein AAF570_02895 [Bacteroidota bacterium]